MHGLGLGLEGPGLGLGLEGPGLGLGLEGPGLVNIPGLYRWAHHHDGILERVRVPCPRAPHKTVAAG